MALRRATAAEMTESVLHDLMESLKDSISRTSQTTRAQAFEFSIQIRDGVIQLVDMDSWDELREPIFHLEPGDVAQQLKRMETGLHRGLQNRLVHGFHGKVVAKVTMKDGTLAFSFFVRRQRKYDWVALAG